MHPAVFRIPSRFHPAYSMLGRWIAERAGDPRRAESLFIVASGVGALVLVLSQILTWTFLNPSPLPFTLTQVTAAGLYAVVCLAGREPEITVEVTDRGVEIARRPPADGFPWRLERRPEIVVVPFRRIRRIRTVPADLFYTHYARYAGTRVFVNRIPPDVLMLELPTGPLFLGMRPEDVGRFVRFVEERMTTASTRVA